MLPPTPRMLPRHTVMPRIGVIDSPTDRSEKLAPSSDGTELAAMRDNYRSGGQAAVQHVMVMPRH